MLLDTDRRTTKASSGRMRNIKSSRQPRQMQGQLRVTGGILLSPAGFGTPLDVADLISISLVKSGFLM